MRRAHGQKLRSVVAFVDYDGTLAPITTDPAKALLPERTIGELRRIARTPGLRLVVVSGRPKRFLSRQLAELRIPFAGEHGGRFYDPDRGRWSAPLHHAGRASTPPWYRRAERIMLKFCHEVPGSFIEYKELSLSWHYRRAAGGAGASRRLRAELLSSLPSRRAAVLTGKSVIEARSTEADKGRFARWYLKRDPTLAPDPIVVAIGDDRTDEDLFDALSPDAVSVKVGRGPTHARFRMSQREVLPFLRELAGIVGSG